MDIVIARPKTEAGFTLVELMTVVAIIAIVASVSVASLNRDTTQSDFDKFARELVQDLNRARIEALSRQEDRAVVISATTGYRLNAVVPGTSTVAAIKMVAVPTAVSIYGVNAAANEPGTSYSVPDSTSLVAEIRFLGTNAVQASVGSGSLTDSSATIYLQSNDTRYRARIVIFQATGYVKIYDSW